jgi:hypothetical protein
MVFYIYVCVFARHPLKVPKREIFMTELFILSDPSWVGDLRSEPDRSFVLSIRLIFTTLFLSFFVCGKNYPPPTEYAVKIIPRLLSMG